MILPASRIQRSGKPLPGVLLAGKAEAQPGGMPGEATHENAGKPELIIQMGSGLCLRQPKQGCPADKLNPSLQQKPVEPRGMQAKLLARGLRPLIIRQGSLSDDERRAGKRPWPKHCGKTRCVLRVCERKTKAQSRK